MAMPGMTFSPGSDKGPSASPVQDAIRLLSFRMPSVVGQGAPSPPGVLAGTPPPPGGGGMPGQGMGGPPGTGAGPVNPILEQFLRLLMQGGMGAQGAGGAGMGWAPPPSVGYTPPVDHAPGPSQPPAPVNQPGPVASAPGPSAPAANPWGDWMRQDRNLGGGPQRFGG